MGEGKELLEKELENYPFLLGTNKVAEVLGIGRVTVWREINSNNLVGVKIRGKLLVLKADLIDYILARRNANAERNVETA